MYRHMYRDEQAKIEYERDGVAHIKNVFTYREVAQIRAEAYSCLMKASPDKPYKHGGRLQMSKRGGPALMFWPSLISKYLNEIRCDERLAFTVKAFLGDDVKQLNNQLYYRLPNDGDGFAWHQDVMFRKAMALSFNALDYLQTIIVVDPMTKENGAISFILGSHKCGDLNLCSKENLRRACDFYPPTIFENIEAEHPLPVKMIEAQPGDVLLWNALTVHGSRLNMSHHSRMTYMNGFCKASACERFPHYLDDNGNTIADVDVEAIPYD